MGDDKKIIDISPEAAEKRAAREANQDDLFKQAMELKRQRDEAKRITAQKNRSFRRELKAYAVIGSVSLVALIGYLGFGMTNPAVAVPTSCPNAVELHRSGPSWFTEFFIEKKAVALAYDWSGENIVGCHWIAASDQPNRPVKISKETIVRDWGVDPLLIKDDKEIWISPPDPDMPLRRPLY